MAIVHVKTRTGFECDINEIVFDDMEVLDYISAIDGGDLMKYPPLLTKLFTANVKKALYDHVRSEDGRVPYSSFEPEITDIFNAVRGGKN